MDLVHHQLAERRIHQALGGHPRQTPKPLGHHHHLEVTATFGTDVSRVQGALVHDRNVLGSEPLAQGILDRSCPV